MDSTQFHEAVEIRPFVTADRELVIQLWDRCGLLRPWNDPHKDIDRKLTEQPELFLVAVCHGDIVGSIMFGYEGHRGSVNYVAVDLSCRRLGLGQRLMNEVESILKSRGCPKINLNVRSSNSEALNFYQSIGYNVDDCLTLGKRLIPDG